jgi:hypothetical protein
MLPAAIETTAEIEIMADPNILPEDESKKDTVRINLPPGLMTPGSKPKAEDPSKRETSAMGPDQAKKETAMMGMPAEAKKETSRVAVPAAKPPASDMPRPTVRLRREPGSGAPPAPAATPTPASRAQVPEMPRPTVKLKVEEGVAAAAPTQAPTAATVPSPAAAPAPTPVPLTMEAPTSGLDIGLSVAAAVLSVAVLGYLAFSFYK